MIGSLSEESFSKRTLVCDVNVSLPLLLLSVLLLKLFLGKRWRGSVYPDNQSLLSSLIIAICCL